MESTSSMLPTIGTFGKREHCIPPDASGRSRLFCPYVRVEWYFCQVFSIPCVDTVAVPLPPIFPGVFRGYSNVTPENRQKTIAKIPLTTPTETRCFTNPSILHSYRDGCCLVILSRCDFSKSERHRSAHLFNFLPQCRCRVDGLPAVDNERVPAIDGTPRATPTTAAIAPTAAGAIPCRCRSKIKRDFSGLQ